jgi:hypothetical protein
MAAELVETTQVFARTVARIEPAWLESLAMHLVKRNYTDPHWEKKRGQVVAKETLMLYGLPIVAQRPIHFGAIDPPLARDIFIRSALVEGLRDGTIDAVATEGCSPDDMPIERVKELTRGKRVTLVDFRDLFDDLDVDESVREELKALTPAGYVGVADELVDEIDE